MRSSMLAMCVVCSLGIGGLSVAGEDSPLHLRRVAHGFASPTYVISYPGETDRLLVLEQYTGLIHAVDKGRVLATPFLDLDGKISTSGIERGLLCIAFHPNYGTNRWVFVSYTDKDGHNVLERYQVTHDNDLLADVGTAREIMRIQQPNAEHNAGTILFGPHDGYLYFSVGDGGFFTANSAQNLANPLGAILRIDVNGPEDYTVPASNPFVNTAGADPRIWVYGLRNPWRFCFDRLTGDMYIGDVGEFTIEEVNLLPHGASGANFGWPMAEGFSCRGGSGQCGSDPGLTPPIHDYRHQLFQPNSVTGGFVYRGTAIPQLVGHYFFADYPTGRFWTLLAEDGKAVDVRERTQEIVPPGNASIARVSSFGVDGAGDIYIVDYQDGEIFKVVTAAGLADVNYDGEADAIDIQLVINAALGLDIGGLDADIHINGAVDAQDIQLVINGVLMG